MLLAIAMSIAMMPFAVFADAGVSNEATETERWADAVYVLGIQINESNCNNVLGDGTVSYDRDSRTLTLNNASLDLSDYDDSAFTENNYVCGISASMGEVNLILKGRNTITSSAASFENDKEYVYGISADDVLNISGNGTLDISINTEAQDIKFYGIYSSRQLNVDGSSLSINMSGSGDSNGIFTGWKGFALMNRADISVYSTGGNSWAVYDVSYRKSGVEYGSSFEMISDHPAFQAMSLSDSLKEGSIKVNENATALGASEWDKETALSSFRYVKLLGNSGGGSRPSGDLYILGRSITEKGIVSSGTVPHSGKIEYDPASNTLTLTNASIDLDNFITPPPGNLCAGIYAMSDLNIILSGSNTITASADNYADGTEYVSGIECWGRLVITGSADDSLSISLAGNNASGNSKVQFVGISSDESLIVNKAHLSVNMGSYGKCTGIYGWEPIIVNNGAIVKVDAVGSGAMAVNGVNSIGNTEINDNSEFEMSAGGVAFNCWVPGASLKAAKAEVSVNQDGSELKDWDKSSRLTGYKYVKFTGRTGEAYDEDSGERFGDDILVLGKLVDEDNCDDILGDGSVSYDFDTKTLTLNNADLDLKKFHHRYDDSEDPDSGCNFAAGIDADDNITIKLVGRNRIYSTAEDYSKPKREYIYGLNSGTMNSITITGAGSLDISLDKDIEGPSYTGISMGKDFILDGVAVNVSLSGVQKGTGIDDGIGDLKIINNASLRVSALGGSSTACYYTFADGLTIGDGSVFEMKADGKAFNNAFLSSSVKDKGALVSEDASADNAQAWDRTTYIGKYKYVRFPEVYNHVHELMHFEAKSASCIAPGNTEYWVCWHCGSYFSDNGNTETDPDEIFLPKTGHKYLEWKSISDTQHERVCEYDTSHKVTADHTFDDGKITKTATLLRKGEKTYTCTTCHGTKTVEISLREEVKETTQKVARRIIEWIRNIFSRNDAGAPGAILRVTLSQPAFTYNGNVQMPAVESVRAGDMILDRDEYTVSYSDDNSRNAGKYTVTVTAGEGKQIVSGTAGYTIEEADITAVDAGTLSFAYDGRIHKPTVRSVKAGLLKLRSSDYNVVYLNRNSAKAGKYFAKIKGKGNFCGAVLVAYTIGKAVNTLAVHGKTAAVSHSRLMKKAQVIKASEIMKIRGAKGKLMFALAGVSAAAYKNYFKVDPLTGNLTIGRNIKKGTYTLRIRAKAAGTVNYKAAAKTVKCIIRIR